MLFQLNPDHHSSVRTDYSPINTGGESIVSKKTHPKMHSLSCMIFERANQQDIFRHHRETLFNSFIALHSSLELATNQVYYLLKPIIFGTLFFTRQYVYTHFESLQKSLIEFLSGLHIFPSTIIHDYRHLKRLVRLFFLFEQLTFSLLDPEEAVTQIQDTYITNSIIYLKSEHPTLHLLSVHLLYPIFFAIVLKENYNPLSPIPNAPAGVHSCESILKKGRISINSNLLSEQRVQTIAEGLRSRQVFLGISRTTNPSDTTANRFNFIYSTLVRFFKVPPPAIPISTPLLTSPPRFIKAPFIPDAIFDLVQSTEVLFVEQKAKAKATPKQPNAPPRGQNIPPLTQNVPLMTSVSLLNPQRTTPGQTVTMLPYVPSQSPVPGPPITMQPFVPSQPTAPGPPTMNSLVPSQSISQVTSNGIQDKPKPKTKGTAKSNEGIQQIDLAGWTEILASTDGKEEEKTKTILNRNRDRPGFRASLDTMNNDIETRLGRLITSQLNPKAPDQPPKNTSDTESWIRLFRLFWILFLEVYDTTQKDPPTLSPDIACFGDNNLHRFILFNPFCNPNDVEENGPKSMEERTEIFWANEILLSISRFFIKLQRTPRHTFDYILKRIDLHFNDRVVQLKEELRKNPKRTLTEAEDSIVAHIAAFLVMLVDSGLVTRTKQNDPIIPQDEQKDYDQKMKKWKQDRETFEKQYLAKIKKSIDDSKLGWINLQITNTSHNRIGTVNSRKIHHQLRTKSTYQDLRLSIARTEKVQPTSVHLFWFDENCTESVAELPEVLFEREYNSHMNVTIDSSNPVALNKVEIPYPDNLKTEPPKPQGGRASYPPLKKTPVTVNGFKIDDLIEFFRERCFSSPTILSSSTLLFNSLTFSPEVKFKLSEGKDVDWSLAIQSNMFMDVYLLLNKHCQPLKERQLIPKSDPWITNFLKEGGLAPLLFRFINKVNTFSTVDPHSGSPPQLLVRLLEILTLLVENAPTLVGTGVLNTIIPNLNHPSEMTAEESVRYSLLLAATSIHLRQHGLIFPFSSLLHITSPSTGVKTLIFKSETTASLPSTSLNLLHQLSNQSKSLFNSTKNLDLKEVRARVLDLINTTIFDPHFVTCLSAWAVRDRSLLSSVKDDEAQQFDDFVSNQSREHRTVIGNLLKARKNHLPPRQLYVDLILSSVGSPIMDSPYLSLLITEETSKQILKEESAKILLHLLFLPTQAHLLTFHQRDKLMELLKNILTLPGTNGFYPTDLCQLSLMILLSSSKTPITIESKDVTGDVSVTPPTILLSLCLKQASDAVKTFKAIRIDNMPLVDFIFKSFLNPSNHFEQPSAINRHINNHATRTCLFDILNMLLDKDSNQDNLLEMFGKCETYRQNSIIPVSSPSRHTRRAGSEVLPKGLTNPRNACFMNSVVIQLFHHQQFRNNILSFSPPPFSPGPDDSNAEEDPAKLGDQINRRNTLLALRRLFTDLLINSPGTQLTVEELTKYIRGCDGASFSVQQQDDASDFFQAFVNQDAFLDAKEYPQLFQKLFQTTTVSHTICPNGDFSHDVEESVVTRVPIATHSKLVDCLAYRALGQKQLGMKFCLQCRSNFDHLYQSHTFENTSNTLVFYIVRNLAGKQYSLDWDRFEIPFMGLDITPFTEENRKWRQKDGNGEFDRFKTMENTSKNDRTPFIHNELRPHPAIPKEKRMKNLFDLSGFVTFVGHPDQGGHYRSYVRLRQETNNFQWMRFDDDKVQKVSKEEAKVAAEGNGKDGCEYGFLLFYQRRFPERIWPQEKQLSVNATHISKKHSLTHNFRYFEMGDVSDENEQMLWTKETPKLTFQSFKQDDRTIKLDEQIQHAYNEIGILKQKIEDSYVVQRNEMEISKPSEWRLFQREMEDPSFTSFFNSVLERAKMQQTQQVNENPAAAIQFARHFLHTTLRISEPDDDLRKQKQDVISTLSSTTVSRSLVSMLNQEMKAYLAWIKEDTKQARIREELRNEIGKQNNTILSLRAEMKQKVEDEPATQPKVQNRFGRKQQSSEQKKLQTEMDQQILTVDIPKEKIRDFSEEVSPSLIVAFVFHCHDERQKFFFEIVQHALWNFAQEHAGKEIGPNQPNPEPEITDFFKNYLKVLSSGLGLFLFTRKDPRISDTTMSDKFNAALSLLTSQKIAEGESEPSTSALLHKSLSDASVLPRLFDLIFSPSSPLLPEPTSLFSQGPMTEMSENIFCSQQNDILKMNPAELDLAGLVCFDIKPKIYEQILEATYRYLSQATDNPFTHNPHDGLPSMSELFLDNTISQWLQSRLLEPPHPQNNQSLFITICCGGHEDLFEKYSHFLLDRLTQRGSLSPPIINLSFSLVDLMTANGRAEEEAFETFFQALIDTCTEDDLFIDSFTTAVQTLPKLRNLCMTQKSMTYFLTKSTNLATKKPASKIIRVLFPQQPMSSSSHGNPADKTAPSEPKVSVIVPFHFGLKPPPSESLQSLDPSELNFILFTVEFLQTNLKKEVKKDDVREKLRYSELIYILASLLCSSNIAETFTDHPQLHQLVPILLSLLIPFQYTPQERGSELKSILTHNLSILQIQLHLVSKIPDCIDTKMLISLSPPTEVLNLVTSSLPDNRIDKSTIDDYASVLLSLLIIQLEQNPSDLTVVFPEGKKEQVDGKVKLNTFSVRATQNSDFFPSLIALLSSLFKTPFQIPSHYLCLLLQSQLLHHIIHPHQASPDQSKPSIDRLYRYFSKLFNFVDCDVDGGTKSFSDLLFRNMVSTLALAPTFSTIAQKSFIDLSALRHLSKDGPASPTGLAKRVELPISFVTFSPNDESTPLISTHHNIQPTQIAEKIMSTISYTPPSAPLTDFIQFIVSQKRSAELKAIVDCLSHYRSHSFKVTPNEHSKFYFSIQICIVQSLRSIINQVLDTSVVKEFWRTLAIFTTTHFDIQLQTDFFSIITDLLPSLSINHPQLVLSIVETIERHFSESWTFSTIQRTVTSYLTNHPFLSQKMAKLYPKCESRTIYPFTPEYKTTSEQPSDKKDQVAFSRGYCLFLQRLLDMCVPEPITLSHTTQSDSGTSPPMEGLLKTTSDSLCVLRLVQWFLYLTTPHSKDLQSSKLPDNQTFRKFFPQFSPYTTLPPDLTASMEKGLRQIFSLIRQDTRLEQHSKETDILVWPNLLLSSSHLFSTLSPQQPTLQLRPFRAFIPESLLSFIFGENLHPKPVVSLHEILRIAMNNLLKAVNPPNINNIFSCCRTLQYILPSYFGDKITQQNRDQLKKVVDSIQPQGKESQDAILAKNALVRISQFPPCLSSPVQLNPFNEDPHITPILGESGRMILHECYVTLYNFLRDHANFVIGDEEIKTSVSKLVQSERVFLLFQDQLTTQPDFKWNKIQVYVLEQTSNSLFEPLHRITVFKTDSMCLQRTTSQSHQSLLPPLPSVIEKLATTISSKSTKTLMNSLADMLNKVICLWCSLSSNTSLLATIRISTESLRHKFHELHSCFGQVHIDWMTSFTTWLDKEMKSQQFFHLVPNQIQVLQSARSLFGRFTTPVPPGPFIVRLEPPAYLGGNYSVNTALSYLNSLYETLCDYFTGGTCEGTQIENIFNNCNTFVTRSVIRTAKSTFTLNEKNINSWKDFIFSHQGHTCGLIFKWFNDFFEPFFPTVPVTKPKPPRKAGH